MLPDVCQKKSNCFGTKLIQIYWFRASAFSSGVLFLSVFPLLNSPHPVCMLWEQCPHCTCTLHSVPPQFCTMISQTVQTLLSWFHHLKSEISNRVKCNSYLPCCWHLCHVTRRKEVQPRKQEKLVASLKSEVELMLRYKAVDYPTTTLWPKLLWRHFSSSLTALICSDGDEALCLAPHMGQNPRPCPLHLLIGVSSK